MQGLLDVVFSTEIKSFLFETKTLQAVGANCLEKRLVFKAVTFSK